MKHRNPSSHEGEGGERSEPGRGGSSLPFPVTTSALFSASGKGARWLAARTPRQRHSLSFVAGALSALGFAPFELWPLTVAGLAALLLLIPLAPRLRSALALGWWFGLGHMLVGLHWIAQAFQFQANLPAWSGWIAVVLLSMVMAIYPAAAAGIAWRLGRTTVARIVAFAGGWMLAEWLRGYLFGGFPWNPLGVVWLPVIGVAKAGAIVGGLGLSGVVIAAAGAVLLALEGDRELGGRVAGAIAAVGIGGLFWINGTPVPDTGTRLHIIQANISQDQKWRRDAEERNLRRYLALSREALARGPGLLLWPEAAVPDLLDEDVLTRIRLARLLGSRDLLITGGIKAIRDEEGYAVAAHNSLYVLDARARLLGRYDKTHLVPFGEYLPLRGLLTPLGLSRLAPGSLDFWPGVGARTLRLPGFPPVGPLVCYEIIISGHVADRSDRPAWLLNASNDAWFSSAGAYMHLAQAQLRAIEEGLPIARATPTGVSAVIDPHGRVLSTIPRHRMGSLTAMLPGALRPTPYALGGEAIPVLLALLLTAAAIVLDRRSKT
jgi:apolipoprotein N-acyltransferase